MTYVIQDKQTGEVLVRNRALGSWWRMPEKCLDSKGRVLKLVYVFDKPSVSQIEDLMHTDTAPDQDDPERMTYVPFADVFKGKAVPRPKLTRDQRLTALLAKWDAYVKDCATSEGYVTMTAEHANQLRAIIKPGDKPVYPSFPDLT